MLKFFWTILGICLAGWLLRAHATENYSMADGTTLTGDIVTFNDAGIKFRLADEKYTDVLPWTKFSQEGLVQLGQNPKIKPLVEPFMELPPTPRVAHNDNIKIQEVSRLVAPPNQSLLGGLASSSVGLLLLILIYATNLYAAFEVATCRGRPVPVVMGLSAVVPIVGPAIYFLLPSEQSPVQASLAAIAAGEASGHAPAAAAANASSGTPAHAAATGTSSRATPGPAGDSTLAEAAIGQPEIIAPSAPKEPVVAQSFKRGQFTFNRRFMETKFAGFMPAVRSAADQKLEFTVKLSQGILVVQRISRIGMNDVHFEVVQGGQLQEVLVPFADIQEINLNSKSI